MSVIIPSLLTLFYFVIYIFRDKISKFSKKNKLLLVFWNFLVNALKIKFNSLWKSIILPIILVGGIFFISLCLQNKILIGPNFSNLEKIISITLVPFTEEFMYRGFLLGLVFIYFPEFVFKKLKKPYKAEYRIPIMGLGLLSTSIFFTTQHEVINLWRYFSGIFYGLLYIYDNNNLTPSLIAHTLNNYISNFVTSC